MTNAMIIHNAQMSLMENGIISGTGNTIEFEDAEGNAIECEEPEAIHTYNAWKKLGFQVQKGEKAIAAFPVWTYKSGKIDEETGEEGQAKMFMKKASFFKASQVAPITA